MVTSHSLLDPIHRLVCYSSHKPSAAPLGHRTYIPYLVTELSPLDLVTPG